MILETRVYHWAPGAPIYRTDAIEFGEWMEKQEVPMSADRLVHLTSDEQTPGHNHVYRYNDEEAIHQHRLMRARQLIHSLKVTVELRGGGTVEVPAYPSVPRILFDAAGLQCRDTTARELYSPLADVMESEGAMVHLLHEAKDRLRHWFLLYRAYGGNEEWAQLRPVFDFLGTLFPEDNGV